MKSVCSLIAVLALAAQAPAQAVILDVSGAQPGKYYYQLTVASGGIVTVTPISQVIKLTDPTPTPTPKPIPDELSDRAKKVKAAVLSVTSDDTRDATAAAMAQLYREIALKVTEKKVTGQEQIAFLVKTSTDMLLAAKKVTEPWVPVRTVITDQWTTLVQDGAKDAAYVDLLNEVAAGLDASCEGSEPQIDVALIIQIMKIVLELLEKFFP